ncbi:MAG: V-type ATP synthase subunit D [Spirochaetes bacterium]|jgi:V/A-type H+-transporting ATPase subunit D|nr:V-type ATP synthase subunit D [Spirochaetota bacterium]
MAKVKLTKNELKQQKDRLSRFKRYLPTLQLKKQQLQMVLRKVEAEEREKVNARERAFQEMQSWIAVFGEPVEMEELVKIKELVTSDGNIAGIDIPVFEGISFEEILWDLYETPVWVDSGVSKMREIIGLDAEIRVLREQHERIAEELRVTSQRVNLFEKVMIPETQENIRRIQIYLGDQQTAQVVRGKFAKRKVERRA